MFEVYDTVAIYEEHGTIILILVTRKRPLEYKSERQELEAPLVLFQLPKLPGRNCRPGCHASEASDRPPTGAAPEGRRLRLR